MKISVDEKFNKINILKLQNHQIICKISFEIEYHAYEGKTATQWTSWDNTFYTVQPGKYVMQNDNKRRSIIKPLQIMTVQLNAYTEIIIQWDLFAQTSLKFYYEVEDQIDIETRWDGKSLKPGWRDYVIVIRDSSIKNKSFFTDSNGLIMVERVLNKREDYIPVYNSTDFSSGNFYPMTSIAYIEDESINSLFSKQFNQKGRRMMMFTDRPQGVTSREEGEIEINIDRTAGDDKRGVGESLDKTGAHQLKHRLVFQNKKSKLNTSIFEAFHKWDDTPLIFVTETLMNKFKTDQLGYLRDEQPFLRISLSPINKSIFLLRLQNIDEKNAHQFQVLKDDNCIILSNFLINHKVTVQITEMTLNGIQTMESQLKSRPDYDGLGQNRNIDQNTSIYKNGDETINITPRQIRTLKIEIYNISKYESSNEHLSLPKQLNQNLIELTTNLFAEINSLNTLKQYKYEFWQKENEVEAQNPNKNSVLTPQQQHPTQYTQNQYQQNTNQTVTPSSSTNIQQQPPNNVPPFSSTVNTEQQMNISLHNLNSSKIPQEIDLTNYVPPLRENLAEFSKLQEKLKQYQGILITISFPYQFNQTEGNRLLTFSSICQIIKALSLLWFLIATT